MSNACLRLPRVSAMLLAALFLALATGRAEADNYHLGSLASPFLQSKTEMSLLERDDKVDAKCGDKQFVKADPVRAPETRVVDGINERTWRELWTLARCGAKVYYMVFFTEEGQGGTSYGIVGPGPLEQIAAYRDAQPAAAPPSQNFLVYFDFNRDSIGADAVLILQSVVKDALKRGIPHIALIGHTDTVGGSAYNQQLSEHRARAVQAFLEGHGIPAIDITAVGKGKTDLRVATPDQVRKQENRNVQIVIR